MGEVHLKNLKIGDVVKQHEDKKAVIINTYPLIKNSDMPEQMQQESMELAMEACEKYFDSNEAAAKMIKQVMDEKFGPAFQVVVGEGFGFEISFECGSLLYMFFGGNLAVCIWKCG